VKLRHQLIIDFYLGTVLHAVLKPFVILAGRLMRRDHDLSRCRSVTIIKMLGGGSLTIAYPALAALRQTAGIEKLRLVTTPAIRPFAEALGVFDDITVIRVGSLAEILRDTVAVIVKFFRCDAIVDLEIHSRLTTVLSLMMCARNRVGFYTLDSFWRRNLSTHLLFCNVTGGTYYFYDQIAMLFGAEIREFAHYQKQFRDLTGVAERRLSEEKVRIAIAPCTSDLGRERMLRTDEWLAILQRRLAEFAQSQSADIRLFAAPGDEKELEGIAGAIRSAFPRAEVSNRAGKNTLAESIRELSEMDELICVDSSLMHYSRLLGVVTRSWWGPTDPQTRLRPWPNGGDEVNYVRLPCSPCIHLTHYPPCRGENICMRLAVNPELPILKNRPWLVPHEAATRITRTNAP
jgi:ADP-heptose:LPS heptosyltransferase